MNSCTTSAVATTVHTMLTYLKPLPPSTTRPPLSASAASKAAVKNPKSLTPSDILPERAKNSYQLALPVANAKIAAGVSKRRAKELRKRVDELRAKRKHQEGKEREEIEEDEQDEREDSQRHEDN